MTVKTIWIKLWAFCPECRKTNAIVIKQTGGRDHHQCVGCRGIFPIELYRLICYGSVN
ncbi:hypothetical protein ES708_23346 [subsurface metagenome]